MPIKVTMPQMGESIFEGTVTKWLKSIGEQVERDEPLFEISTDKVDSEIPSPAAGVLREILVKEGETVQINTVVALLSGEGEGAPEPVASDEKSEAEPIPSGIAASVQAEIPPAVEEILGASASAADEAASEVEMVAATTQAETAEPGASQDIRTSPLVRRLAREHGINLASLEGTGLSGRITKQDVERHIAGIRGKSAATPVSKQDVPAEQRESMKTSPPAAKAPAGTAKPPTGEPLAAVTAGETVAMSVMRKSISDHMVMSKRTSAHVATVFHVEMSAISVLREANKEGFKARNGVNLTYTPFFVKGLVDTVREFPLLNSAVEGDSIRYHKPVNVGIAVALEAGLIVPVVRDAHLKSFTGIALAIHDLAERARSRKLKPEEVQNGTITITNPGIYGALFGTPIINQPQVAILGVGGIEKRPVVINDAIAIRPMVYLYMSFDHRVIDGAVADQAMAALKARLEGWTRWID